MAAILVVDDDAANRMLVRKILEYAGHVVHEASSGELALSMANDVQPALAIVDLHMPGMSGAELIKALRERTSTTRVALYTASPESPMLDDFMQAFGIEHVIPKPSDPDAILRIVGNALASSQ